jgi:hypothetical protein
MLLAACTTPSESRLKAVNGRLVLEGLHELPADTSLVADEILIRNGTVLVANGYALSISARTLAIEGEATVHGLSDRQINLCSGIVFPAPPPGRPGYNYQPGPDAPDKASAGMPGAAGGTGGYGLIGNPAAACVPLDAPDVEIKVAEKATGRLNVDLRGGNGASGNPSSNGGPGGRGQQGGRCPPGPFGQRGGRGGTGGAGGDSPLNPHPSGNGGNLVVSIAGIGSTFELVRVDLGAGEHGDSGVPGDAGQGGPGGNGGRGGPGCAGIENTYGYQGFAGRRGAQKFSSLGSAGTAGTLTLSGIEYWPPAASCDESTEPDEQASARAIKQFWEISAQRIFSASMNEVATQNSLRPAFVIQNASLSGLLSLPFVDPARGSLDNQIFLNLTQPYPVPIPVCKNTTDTALDSTSCCKTMVNSKAVESPFVGCMGHLQNIVDARPDPLDQLMFGLMVGRSLAREIAKSAVLTPADTSHGGLLVSDAFYLQIAGPEPDKTWPGKRHLLLRLDSALFERIAGSFSAQSPEMSVVLGEAIPKWPAPPSSLGLMCSARGAEARVSPLRVGSAPDEQPKQGFSKFSLVGAAEVSFDKPDAWASRGGTPAMTVYSYRGKSVIEANLLRSAIAPSRGAAEEACRFVSEAAWRQDELLACANLPIAFVDLSGDFLRVRELRSIIFNYAYIASFGALLKRYY